MVCQVNKILDEYYQVLGWTDNGIPKQEVLEKLGLA
jgi:aldehyde:ferredoxin oxidoreductase